MTIGMMLYGVFIGVLVGLAASEESADVGALAGVVIGGIGALVGVVINLLERST